MNKTELKKILKPLIKECIKEVIFEDGTLSTVISEVVKGLGNSLVESRSPRISKKPSPTLETDQQASGRRQKRQENRKRMLDAIGRDTYNGVDLFEGTTPVPAQQDIGKSPLSGVDPSDSGVDISSFASSGAWKKLAGN